MLSFPDVMKTRSNVWKTMKCFPTLRDNSAEANGP